MKIFDAALMFVAVAAICLALAATPRLWRRCGKSSFQLRLGALAGVFAIRIVAIGMVIKVLVLLEKAIAGFLQARYGGTPIPSIVGNGLALAALFAGVYYLNALPEPERSGPVPPRAGTSLALVGEELRREPILDGRSPDELLGYDENGLPT